MPQQTALRSKLALSAHWGDIRPMQSTSNPSERLLHGMASLLAPLLVAMSGDARATVRDFPAATAPCNTTLQACVDAADPFDTIRIAAGTYSTNLTIRKSLTVVGVNAGQGAIIGGNIYVDAELAGLVVAFDQLTFDRVTAVYGLTAEAFSLAVTSSVIRGAAEERSVDVLPAADLPSATPAAGSIVLRGNQIVAGRSTSGGFNCQSGVRVVMSRPFDVTIVDNSINVLPVTPGTRTVCEAVRIASSRRAGQTKIDRNRIQGGTLHYGIVAIAFDGSRMQAEITNNAISGINGASSFVEGSISLATVFAQSEVDALVANNTMVGARSGLRVDVGADGILSGLVANNIIAGTTNAAFTVSGAAAGFANRHNLIFASDVGQVAYGPGTVFADPQFRAPLAGDWQLALNSPAVDAGDNSALPTAYLLDAAGQPRRVGAVDMGAFEASAGRLDIDASGLPTRFDAGTDGLLIVRRLLGYSGAALVQSATGANSTRDAAGIADYIDSLGMALDVDGDGAVQGMTDGLLILRYLLGFRGEALTAATGNSIASANVIGERIQALMQ